MNKKWIRNAVKQCLIPFYRLFNIFYLPFLRNYFFRKIEKIPESTQLFFMTRFDLGPVLLLMHYAQCWHRERGPACLVVFTTLKIIPLCKLICPDVQVIHFENLFSRGLFFLFRRAIIQFYTLNPIYAFAAQRWPYALYLYDMTFTIRQRSNLSCYVAAFDPVPAQMDRFSPAFKNAYLAVRKILDYRYPIMQDMIQLFYRVKQQRPQSLHPCGLLEMLKIESPYVVINLNTKDYGNPMQNSRRIQYPERYNAVIDFLISKGYHVVIQGREEQPHLPQRKGLIEAFKTPYATPENDFHLYNHCEFAICCKTGPEILASVCNKPSLGLNYTELAHIIPNGRSRFFPKHVYDANKKTLIPWKELLERPMFYHIQWNCYEEGIEFIDLEEEELLEATQEFLQMLPLPDPLWTNYTPLQQEFRNALHPAHLDLYHCIEVPCESYLASSKYPRRSLMGNSD